MNRRNYDSANKVNNGRQNSIFINDINTNNNNIRNNNQTSNNNANRPTNNINSGIIIV